MRDKLLKSLKKDSFVSGEQLATDLKVSRTAVWKQIRTLKDLGYEIKSVKNKGYKLISRPDITTPEEIYNDLRTQIIGKKIHYFKSVSSTNLCARKIIEKNFEEGTIIVSDVQKKGRGRKDRSWSSPKGGLWFSAILFPDIPPQNAMLITMTTSIAVAQSIQKIGLKPIIKWPNDVLVNNKKICGVLTEIDAEIDKINSAIVGVGININNTLPDDLNKTATSIKKELGRPISRVNFFKNLLENFDTDYNQLKSGNYDNIREKWLFHSDIIGRKIRVNNEKNNLTGIVHDIDQNGSILLNTKNGDTKIFSGDVTYL